MIWYMNPEAIADIEASDPNNPTLAAWRTAQQQYSVDPNALGALKNFWMVVRMRSAKFSEHIEFVEEPSMILPKEGHGEFAGVATTRQELSILVEKESAKYVYFVFQVKIQGPTHWRELLEFLGNHDMLSTFT